MILYLDASSILKLYVRERGSQETRSAVAGADQLVTSLITYTEVRAALARARRGRRIRSNRALADLKEDFEVDWLNFLPVDVSEQLVKIAGDLAEQYALSGSDGIHLASAVGLRSTARDDLRFSAWDQRLIGAAISESLPLAHGVSN